MWRLCFSFVLIISCLFTSNLLSAQVSTASLTGLVLDQTNAAAVNVKVTVLNHSTGFKRSVETDKAGYYYFPELPIGIYGVRVEQQGFATLRETITLDTAQKARRDFVLRVGSAEETVEVAATAGDLSRDDASIGSVVDRTTVEQTPLYLRNWDDLLRTVAGVQINRFTQQSGATSAGRVGDFNVHGVHTLQNNFMLDGIDNNTFSENVQELSTEAAHPSVDTIEEFNIVTNPYSAEYGRSPGAAVSVNTKSGSNQIHGLAYEYLRNNFFDANDFFSDRNDLTKPENNQNQFGGNFGGPLIKDHLFGFFDYEGTRIKQGVSRIATVPLPNERIGDFSPATGAEVGVSYPTITDPTTGQPFPNNQIPAGRIDTAVAKLMTLFPQPNLPGELNNYTRNALATDNDDSYDGRIDWIPSQQDTVFGRFSYSNRSRFIPGFFGGIADGTSTSAWGRQILKSGGLVIGWTHVISPTILNSFRLGWIRNYSFAEQDPFGQNAANEFVPGIPNNPAVAGGVPLTSFTGYAFLGSPDFLPKRQIPQQYEWVDTLSVTHGKHSLKFGVSAWAPMRNIFQDEPGMRGDLTFTGTFSGFPYADGLLGLTQMTQLTNVFFVDQRLWMAAGFAQDDWKVTPKFTLNLGLRYDFAAPATDAKDRMANFDPAGAGSLVFAKSGSLADRALVQPNTKNFGPRVGFAYSPAASTVIRGGYGIYYTLFERYGSENQLALNPPFLVNEVLASNTTPVLSPEQGFPANFLDPNAINFGQLQAFHIRSTNPVDKSPMVEQWSFGVQHEFLTDWMAELNYVGTRSTRLYTLTNFNQPLIVNGVSTGIAPYPNFGYVEYSTPNGIGNYHGLEATLSRRFRNGLHLQAAYTYSHSLDNVPEELETSSGGPPNGRDFGAWYGSSDFDVRNRVSISYVYDLPFGPGKTFLDHGIASYILGGFETSGVYTYYSGHPFTVNLGGGFGSELDPFGTATAVPNVIGTPHIVGSPDCWFYASGNSNCGQLAPGLSDAFAVTGPGVVGDSGRNTLVGPHTNVFDASLMRNFTLTERMNLQFRWEVFNAANTVLFGQPQNNFTSSAVGKITTLSGDPRVMQFALRLGF